VHGGEQIGIVGQRPEERRPASGADRMTAGHQTCRRDDESRAGHFRESSVAELPEPDGQCDQRNGRAQIDATLVSHDLRFDLRSRELEIQRDEPLACAGLQILEPLLVEEWIAWSITGR